MTDALRLRSVTLSRGRRTVLRELDLQVKRGEFVGVIGPNGAGKTTMLESFTGAVSYRGSLSVLGEEVGRLPPGGRSRFRTRIGFVPQLGTEVPTVPLTVREVVAIGRTGRSGLLRRLGREDRRICATWMERLGLTELSARPFRRLSGGEQRKVHLARALAQEPELLLLDEPAGHLDFRWQEEMTALVGSLWRETGLTVIMVTHEVRHLPAGCDRFVLVGDGRLLGSGSAKSVLDPALVSRAFGVGLEVVQREGRYHLLPSGSGSVPRTATPPSGEAR